MEFIEDLWNRRMKRIMLVSFAMMLITAMTVIFILESSGFGGTIEEIQLGFDAEIIKSCFLLMSSEGMKFFILGNLVDYLFMIAYGSFFYSSARFLTRNYRTESITKKIGCTFAWIGILAAICDGIENIFLLSMTANPMGFSNWLAIAHSSFAFSKFLFMFSTVIWLMISFILNLIVRVLRHNK